MVTERPKTSGALGGVGTGIWAREMANRREVGDRGGAVSLPVSSTAGMGEVLSLFPRPRTACGEGGDGNVPVPVEGRVAEDMRGLMMKEVGEGRGESREGEKGEKKTRKSKWWKLSEKFGLRSKKAPVVV